MTRQSYKVGKRRMMLLCEGSFDMHSAKTATGLIIWCPDEVVAVIDSRTAGQPIEKIVGFGRGIPIVKSVAEGVKLGASQLVIGVANVGGYLVPSYRPMIVEAIKAGCDVVNGLHEILSEDRQFAALAKRHHVRIRDLRLVPPTDCAWNRARDLKNNRVLMVGSDCNVGKMCTALMLTREFTRRRLDAKFIATGQTGIMISGEGLCIDRAISDFAAGVAEKLVLDSKDHRWLFIEGQGSIDHPAYSGVTLSLLHGTAPQALILCHVNERVTRRHDDGSPLRPLKELVRLHEVISAPILPAKVVGVSLMTRELGESAAKAQLRRIEKDLGLPATDPLRFGVENLADALLKFYGNNGNRKERKERKGRRQSRPG